MRLCGEGRSTTRDSVTSHGDSETVDRHVSMGKALMVEDIVTEEILSWQAMMFSVKQTKLPGDHGPVTVTVTVT